ncbi:MAG: hypothetical protein EPN61_08480 [Burkholderiaceae bacterium]|nr:MAG: hypothetical protein EPN61_08480 [Burkholderiaceae bacterium]
MLQYVVGISLEQAIQSGTGNLRCGCETLDTSKAYWSLGLQAGSEFTFAAAGLQSFSCTHWNKRGRFWTAIPEI